MVADDQPALDELIKIIPAPDFPTAWIIYGVGDLQEGYRTGRGRVVMRARTHVEDLGITAIWLLPLCPSPGKDDGYDISNYMDVHSDVGTVAVRRRWPWCGS